MEMVWIILTAALFLWYMVYDKSESKKEKITIIRELTTALTSKWAEQYRESVPTYWWEQKEEKKVIEDEIVDIEQVDPTQLLRSLKD